jgi:uncharacterized protein (TIGR03382 family)
MKSRLALPLLLAAALPSVAHAHIHMLQPKSRTDAAQGDPQKTAHCGDTGYSRAAHPERVTWYKPGQTVRVMWQETIDHPGWYRIALQPNGETFSYPPPSNGPAGGGAPSNYPTVNQTGMTDAATGTIVLLDRIADGAPGTTQMADITLPTTECMNCTLQFTQFMTNNPPYAIVDNDIYYNCADIVISANDPPPPMTPDAGPTSGPDAGNPADGDGPIKGGCSTSGSGSRSALLLLALLALRRRR